MIEATYHFVKGQGWVPCVLPPNRLGWVTRELTFDENDKIDNLINNIPEHQRFRFTLLLGMLTSDRKWNESAIRRLLPNDRYFRDRYRELRYWFRHYSGYDSHTMYLIEQVYRFWGRSVY